MPHSLTVGAECRHSRSSLLALSSVFCVGGKTLASSKCRLTPRTLSFSGRRSSQQAIPCSAIIQDHTLLSETFSCLLQPVPQSCQAHLAIPCLLLLDAYKTPIAASIFRLPSGRILMCVQGAAGRLQRTSSLQPFVSSRAPLHFLLILSATSIANPAALPTTPFRCVRCCNGRRRSRFSGRAT